MTDALPSPWQEQLLRDLQGWLTQLDGPDAATPAAAASAADAPPSLDTVEDDATLQEALAGPDLHTLYSELAALRQEIRLQNREQARAVRQSEQSDARQAEFVARLEAAMLPLQRWLAGQTETAAPTAAQLAAAVTGARQAVERACLTPLLEVRDALVRGLDGARHVVQGRRWFRPGGLDAVVEGYQMALDRFDRVLAAAGVRRVPTQGVPFEPRTMMAVETRADPAAADGVVLAELRTGFVQDGGALLRAAEVVVNGNPSRRSAEPAPENARHGTAG